MAAASGKRPRFPRIWLAVLGLAILFTSLPSFDGWAQEVVRRRGLLDFLFGGPPPREDLPPVRQERSRAARERSRPAAQPRSGGAPAQAAAPAEPAVEKLENARVVLVVGDFLAGGLAEGLEKAYAESPGVRIVDRSNGSSGFVRDDFYDWNSEIEPILDEVEPSVVVVMIGSNDRQQLVVDGKRERPQSAPWLREYRSRVSSFAETIDERGIPIVWTGLPPFKSSSMSSDMLAFNDIYKQTMSAVDGTFVDIWEGFVDENGSFVFSGPDMNGQTVRLRGSDGINLTRPAKRKVAFYVERPLKKLLGAAISPDIDQVDIDNLPALGLPSDAPTDLERTGPISLAGPELDGGDELVGEAATPAQAAAPEAGTTGDIAPAGKPGRADDFSLRRRKPQEEATETKDTSAGGQQPQ